jgi:hypothetical protein
MQATFYWTKMTAAVCLLMLLLSSGAWAGQVDHPEVEVDLATLTASGSLVGARYSADSTQYLTCRVQVIAVDAAPYIVCEARDIQGTLLTCLSGRLQYVDAVLGLNDYGYVAFTVVEDAQGVQRCDTLEVGTFAQHLP